MKRIFLLTLLLTVSLGVCAQTSEQNSEQYSGQIVYATEDKDTLYIEADMFKTFFDVWNQEEYVSEKPILIKVDSVRELYARKTNH